MRRLATIRTIAKLNPIHGADVIEQAIVDGWAVVVKKGEFTVGDACVFFEIDSFLPASEPIYSFLGTPKKYKNSLGYRLKTIKMRGTVSQGLALPKSYWKDEKYPQIASAKIGDDVTEILNVIKWERPVTNANSPLGGNAVGAFPSYLRKTDQERIQNKMQYFNEYKYTAFEETLKLDGSSMTVSKIARTPNRVERIKQVLRRLCGIREIEYYTFEVCSRNVNLQKNKDNLFWKVAISHNMEEILPIGFAIQGELVAPNIQSNWEKVTDPEFYMFDVLDLNENRYLKPTERMLFKDSLSGSIKHVPVINTSIRIFEGCNDLEALQKRVTGPSMNPGTISEGRVYKSLTDATTFKCISNKYLLKGGD